VNSGIVKRTILLVTAVLFPSLASSAARSTMEIECKTLSKELCQNAVDQYIAAREEFLVGYKDEVNKIVWSSPLKAQYSFSAAHQICGELGGRLPTSSELNNLIRHFGADARGTALWLSDKGWVAFNLALGNGRPGDDSRSFWVHNPHRDSYSPPDQFANGLEGGIVRERKFPYANVRCVKSLNSVQ
jgi:hypothetical protein